MAEPWPLNLRFRTLIPTLEAVVTNYRASKPVNFLVDTGASYTIIRLADVVSLLESVPKKEDLVQIGGNAVDMSGRPLLGIKTELTINLSATCSYSEPEVWLAPEVHWAVLGTMSFFDRHGFVVWNWPTSSQGRRFTIFQRRR